jgi:UDP-N-acetylmuramoylalanine-D-glutamate ligase
LKININNFLKTVEFFKGLPHRLENVYNDKNLQIINNSKATNVESLIKSVENFENIFLIVGGRAKESDFTKILNFNKKIKKIYLIGESSKKIFEQLKNDINCEICHTLEESIENSLKNLKNTDKKLTVLFSPGCTSFDQYENFEARGQSFKKIVKKFVNEI